MLFIEVEYLLIKLEEEAKLQLRRREKRGGAVVMGDHVGIPWCLLLLVCRLFM
jgi:hypothetical protein